MVQKECLYLNTALSIDERVKHLLAEMTVEEKVAQLAGVWVRAVINPNRQFVLEKAQDRIPHGIGHITRIGAVSMLPPVKNAELANRIQKYLREETRLGIPAIVHEESCAGYIAREATTFPQAIGQAATWNPELVGQAAEHMREEMRAVGAHHTLAPVLDVVRDPRWGRLEETYGEDPFLISAIANAYINGIQGENWQEGIAATAKHFIGYSLSEGGLNWAPAHLPERLKREIYLTPFKAALDEAKVATFMNAYQELDGIPAGSDKSLMIDLLRDELGFDGVVVSDYFTVNMFVDYHKIVATKVEAARVGLESGIDVELPEIDCYGPPLLEAIEAGQVSIELVDTSVSRLLEMKFQLGLFENPYVDSDTVASIYSKNEPVELSRQMAEQSIVLLKNDGLLPLSKDLKSIAVIGAPADSNRLMQGDYHYPAHLEGIIDLSEENMEAPAPGEEGISVDWEDHRPPTVTILDGIRSIVSENTSVHYAKGCEVKGEDTSGFAEAVELAKNADVAIVCAGDKSGLGLDSTSGEALDSATLQLPGVQQQLVEAIVATGTPTLLVLTNGRPAILTDFIDELGGVIEAWLPAEQGGVAVANVLFGDTNPGGKLPVTFPRHVGQVPVFYNHKPSGQRSHWHGDYVDMSVKPLFAFGYGLSYTQFEYSDLKVSHQQASASDTVEISLTLSNTGSISGDEVVQLYIGDPIATVTRPVKALKGFKRLHLAAGESQKLTFSLPVAHYAFYDRDMKFVVEPGEACIMIGSASDDIRLEGSFEIMGETTEVKQVYSTPVEFA